MEELSLVFFTVLAQGAAGLCLALSGMKLVDNQNLLNGVTKNSVIAILALIIAGGIASLTHLGQPFRAMNILSGLGHGSHLSLEVLFVAIFSFSIIGLLLAINKKSGLGNSATIYIACTISGLIMVFAMANVYKLSTVSAWDSVFTPLQFFMTTVLLGFVLASYFVADMLNTKVNKFVQIGSIVVVALYLISLPLISTFYGSQEMASQFAMHGQWGDIRAITLAVGLLLWLVPQFLNVSVSSKKVYISAAVVVLFCSELAGRVYFYDLLNLRVL